MRGVTNTVIVYKMVLNEKMCLYYEKNNPTVTRALLNSRMKGIPRKRKLIKLVDCFTKVY